MKNLLFVLINLIMISSCVDTSKNIRLIQDDSSVSKNQISLEHNVDSISASKVAIDFYKWYAEAIRLDKNEEIQPAFVKDSNGMATLDISKYIHNLRERKFSEGLIKKTTNSFESCIGNLKNIPYDTLNKKFELSDYEDINCDFFNYYEWTSDMDPLDGADITSFSQYNSDIVLKMSFYNIYDNKKSYWKHKYAEVSLIKQTDQWFINDIKITFNK